MRRLFATRKDGSLLVIRSRDLSLKRLIWSLGSADRVGQQLYGKPLDTPEEQKLHPEKRVHEWRLDTDGLERLRSELEFLLESAKTPALQSKQRQVVRNLLKELG